MRVGQTARLNVTMKVAQVAETVNVVGAGAARRRLQDRLVHQHRARADRVAAGRRIATSSGSRSSRPACSASAAATASSATARSSAPAGNASQATIMVDGVDFTDPALGLARARFSQDAISEFRVIANRFDPEIGGSAGGALSIVTKSGTNDLKGSAFGFFRDNVAARAGRARSAEERLLAAAGRVHARRPDRQGPHPLLRLVRADQRGRDPARSGRAARTRRRPRTCRSRSTSRCSSAASITGSATRRTCASKFVYEHYRQQNFRTGGLADLAAGMNLNRDNWNVSVTHSSTLGSGDAEPAVGAGRPPQVRGAEQLAGARRVLLERQHAADRREHRRRPERHRRHLRSARHVLQAPRQRPMGAGR